MSPAPEPSPVRTVDPSMSAREAAQRMERWHVGMLVVTEDERPVGVVTDRDIALRVLAAGKAPGECPVRDCMTGPAVVLKQGQGARAALEAMGSHRIRRLPIVDAHGALTGVLSADDVIRSLGRRVHDLAGIVQRELRNEARPSATGSAVLGRE